MLTDEEWLADSSAAYWVEAGFIAVDNVSVSGIPLTNGTYLFWGDKRPGSVFYGHSIAASPSYAKTRFYISWAATNNFAVTIHTTEPSNTYYYRNSTGNSMVPAHAIYGTEYTSSTAVDAHANWTDIQYVSSEGATSYGSLPSGSYAVGVGNAGHFTWVTQPHSFRAAEDEGC